MRRAKIIATLGPATSSQETIERLLESGVDVVRLNFSHGSHQEHARQIETLRTAESRAERSLALLQDLQGPKIRTGRLVGGQAVSLKAGQRFTITTRNIPGTNEIVSTTYQALPDDLRGGDRILLSDGLIELQVISTSDDEVITEVLSSGELPERQGINLPGVDISAPSLTHKDQVDLGFGLAHGVDYVALSFVRRAADVRELKARIAAAGKDTPVIAKIEKPEALDELPEILAEVSGVMIARGDLGVEMPPEQVPLVQKQIIAACNAAGVSVIVATQMLESMIHNPRPTRAEASDVANAILDGADALMLSGETAVGKYPIEAVCIMARIAEETDAGPPCSIPGVSPRWQIELKPDIDEAISEAVDTICQALPLRAITVFTQTGHTARLMARARPPVPILALTPFETTLRQLNLVWGVNPILCPPLEHLREVVGLVNRELPRRGLAQLGDFVAVTCGHPLMAHGTTNTVQIVRIQSS